MSKRKTEKKRKELRKKEEILLGIIQLIRLSRRSLCRSKTYLPCCFIKTIIKEDGDHGGLGWPGIYTGWALRETEEPQYRFLRAQQ